MDSEREYTVEAFTSSMNTENERLDAANLWGMGIDDESLSPAVLSGARSSARPSRAALCSFEEGAFTDAARDYRPQPPSTNADRRRE